MTRSLRTAGAACPDSARTCTIPCESVCLGLLSILGNILVSALDSGLVAGRGRVRVLAAEVSVGLRVPGDGDQGLPVGQVDQPYAPRLPTGLLDLGRRSPDDPAGGGDAEDLVLAVDHQGTDELTAVVHN